MSGTEREYLGDGYYVTAQFCEHEGCDVFLGINYPGLFCVIHEPAP